jgi:20S proteasome alpha/beta subunit
VSQASDWHRVYQLGSTTVGIQTSQGVVLGVEKRVQSPLLESSSIEKIMEIDNHIGCAMSGLTADARTMVEHARVTAQNHAFTYNEPIKVESVTQAVCDLALRFGESTEDDEPLMVRFLIVAILSRLIAGQVTTFRGCPSHCWNRRERATTVRSRRWPQWDPSDSAFAGTTPTRPAPSSATTPRQ